MAGLPASGRLPVHENVKEAMMRNQRQILGALTAALALMAASAGAQEGEARAGSGERWTAISFSGGFSMGSSDTGAAVGMTVLHNLTSRLALEGTAAYLDRGPGAEALSVNASLLVNLVPSGEKYVPYLAAGGGFYRASFNLGDPRFLGPVGPQFGPGMMYGPGMMFGPSFDAPGSVTGTCPCGELPQFYGRRLGGLVVPASGVWGNRSFTDPALNFGAGARLDITPRLQLRPDARALVVVGEGDTYTVGVFTVNVGFRF